MVRLALGLELWLGLCSVVVEFISTVQHIYMYT